MNQKGVEFRHECRAEDLSAVREIVESTGFFNAEEVGVAVELVDERQKKGVASGYEFVYADVDARTRGYACFGKIPCTDCCYDLYWIVVHAEFRGQGLGKLLLAQSEQGVARLGGRKIYIETSSRELYHPTRQFYLRGGYEVAARLVDFYAPGDDKFIFSKNVG